MPSRYVILLGLVFGLLAGLGGYTFVYAKGRRTWPTTGRVRQLPRDAGPFRRLGKSSHRAVAVCNDCHAPHALIPKYVTKARNGFGTRWPSRPGNHDPIQVTPCNAAIAAKACRTVTPPSSRPSTPPAPGRTSWLIIRCHGTVGHLH